MYVCRSIPEKFIACHFLRYDWSGANTRITYSSILWSFTVTPTIIQSAVRNEESRGVNQVESMEDWH